MTKENYKDELKNILEIAKTNGYEKSIIFKILRKQKNKKLIKSITTLNSIKEKKITFARITYHPEIEYKFRNIFRRFKLTTAFTNNFQIKLLLENSKDKENFLNKPGIYKIDCPKCQKCYIGQTRRNIQVRFKEHIYHSKFHNIDKSAIALHTYETGHQFKIENIKLIKHSTSNKLNMLEAIFMKKFLNNLLNNDLSQINHSLLDLF